jgi:hypothetical protein
MEYIYKEIFSCFAHFNLIYNLIAHYYIIVKISFYYFSTPKKLKLESFTAEKNTILDFEQANFHVLD